MNALIGNIIGSNSVSPWSFTARHSRRLITQGGGEVIDMQCLQTFIDTILRR